MFYQNLFLQLQLYPCSAEQLAMFEPESVLVTEIQLKATEKAKLPTLAHNIYEEPTPLIKFIIRLTSLSISGGRPLDSNVMNGAGMFPPCKTMIDF